jgi:hypothetical protein
MPELRTDYLAVRDFASAKAELHVMLQHVQELLRAGMLAKRPRDGGVSPNATS